jgi:predicted dehydrogenase
MMRVAMLGVGHWHAGMHARGVLRAGAEIAGVWDPDVGAVARFIDACGGITRPDAAAAIDDRPDLVIALGRGPAAAAQLSWLIEQDIPILADKPIGVSHADVAPLADATARRNQFVSVALVNRIAGVVEAMHDRGRLAAIATGTCPGCSIHSRAAAGHCAIWVCMASMPSSPLPTNNRRT